MDDDPAPRPFTGDPYTVELRIAGDAPPRVQLAMFRDHQHPDDALPDVVLNLAPQIAANLGDWLQEYARRAIFDA